MPSGNLGQQYILTPIREQSRRSAVGRRWSLCRCLPRYSVESIATRVGVDLGHDGPYRSAFWPTHTLKRRNQKKAGKHLIARGRTSLFSRLRQRQRLPQRLRQRLRQRLPQRYVVAILDAVLSTPLVNGAGLANLTRRPILVYLVFNRSVKTEPCHW